MIVTEIVPLTKSRYRILLDEQFAFVLYKSELSRYKIKLGAEISEEVYQEIRTEIVLKRAKKYALNLLTDMDRTSDQLVKKLEASEYPEDIIEAAIRYVESFGYVDDTRYACNFIESRKRNKSKKEIYMLMRQKGIESSVIDEAMEQCYGEDDSLEAIQKILLKKKYSDEEMDYKEKQKIYAAIMRKGFSYDDIRRAIQVYGNA